MTKQSASCSLSLKSLNPLIIGSNFWVSHLAVLSVRPPNFSQSSPESLWALINTFQLISLMPLMNIGFPANALLFLDICGFINGDI